MILNTIKALSYKLDTYEHVYPCRCLCLGFSQSTLKTPFLLTILHFEQIVFTEGLTFIVHPPHRKKRKAGKAAALSLPYLLEPIRNSSFRQIIG